MQLIDKMIPVKGRFVKKTRGYREADVQEAIRKTLQEIKKLSETKDEGYEEFERGYNVAYNNLFVIIRTNFGDAFVATDEGDGK